MTAHLSARALSRSAVSTPRVPSPPPAQHLNVLGNAVATIVIGKWEGDFDAARAHSVLHPEKTPPSPPPAQLDTTKAGADT